MLWSRPYTATGAITKNRLVKYAADDTHVSQASAVTDRIVGVYIGPSDAADGDAVEICLLGECNLEVSGAIGRGMRLTTNSSGQGVTAESGGSSRTCAVAMIAGTNSTIPVFVQLGPEVQTLLSDSGDTGTGNYTFNGNTTSNNFIINSASGAIQANSATALYLRGNIADSAGNVGTWIGNGTTLTSPDRRIVGFSRDTPVTHASPVAYVRSDGSYEIGTGGPLVMAGSGTPEGSVTAPVGSIYLRSNGAAGTAVYIKGSGSGNTGWNPEATSLALSYNFTASSGDGWLFVADRPYQVISLKEVHQTAGTDGGAVTLGVRKVTNVSDPGAAAGANVKEFLTADFDLKSTANTTVTGTLTATTADLQLATGDKIGLNFTGTKTSLAGGALTVELRAI